MCNSQNEQLIRDVVIEKIDAGVAFTAYDCTAEARIRGATEQHWAMKNTVHAMFSNGEFSGYDRTSIQTPTGPAWCYHPLGFDLSTYVASIGGTAAPLTVAPSQSIVDSAADSCNEFERKQATDAEGRLPIWSDMLRSIGLSKPGTIVFIEVDNDVLYIADDTANGSVANYSINKDGRIRIGSNTLEIIDGKAIGGVYNVKLNKSERRIEVSVL